MAKRERCARCQRPLPSCYCAELRPLDNHWPVWILQHPQEARHALGTARIAALGLRRCKLEEYTAPSDRHSFAGSELAPVLIYPGSDSAPLQTLAKQSPRPLLFLDGSWRKSRRMLLESPWLQALPRYALEAPPPSRYRIRREPDANAVSTLEAIVYSLGVVEGDAARYQPLLQLMDKIINEQIAHMGQEIYARNYGRD